MRAPESALKVGKGEKKQHHEKNQVSQNGKKQPAYNHNGQEPDHN
jgi:hypothetical protein